MSRRFRKFLLLWCSELISSGGSRLTSFGLGVNNRNPALRHIPYAFSDSGYQKTGSGLPV